MVYFERSKKKIEELAGSFEIEEFKAYLKSPLRALEKAKREPRVNRCLKCDRNFEAKNAYHRLCDNCKPRVQIDDDVVFF